MRDFHTEDGLFFERNEDGSVTVRKYESAHQDAELVTEQIIPGDIWCSVISSMSKHGESDGRFYVAKIFHEGSTDGLLSYLSPQAV